MTARKFHKIYFVSYRLIGDEMKFILKCFKRIVIGSFLLYLFNYFAVTYHFVIPINLITLFVVSIFDVFGLIGLIIFKCIIM